jgi:hypothetical protein
MILDTDSNLKIDMEDKSYEPTFNFINSHEKVEDLVSMSQLPIHVLGMTQEEYKADLQLQYGLYKNMLLEGRANSVEHAESLLGWIYEAERALYALEYNKKKG